MVNQTRWTLWWLLTRLLWYIAASKAGQKCLRATVATIGLIAGLGPCDGSMLHLPNAHAMDMPSSIVEQSARWEQSRLKRTLAIKSMEQKGMLKVNTDDAGNQFLSLPWIPNRKVPYKSLSLQQRLVNEVCAGALGEISKDLLLHSVDTAKTRRQVRKNVPPNTTNATVESGSQFSALSRVAQLKDLYAGFPVVALSSIPQGGAFFLTKKSLIEGINFISPGVASSVLGQALPIGAGVCVYWLFRTPAEVLKTQVQTRQLPNIVAAINQAKSKDSQGVLGLWRYYTVMLSLDIPFQVINFILYGILSEAVSSSGYPSSIWTRLFCGTFCGMIAAGLTCPVDVCKTRIISRDKALQEAAYLARIGCQDSVPTLTETDKNKDVLIEMASIFHTEGPKALFLGLRQRLVYTGLANGIRLAAYGTSRMDFMMRNLDDL